MKKGAFLLAALTVFFSASSPRAEAAAEVTAGTDVVGHAAPSWNELHWLGSSQTAALRDKVVLVRWWSDECPLCKSTLPGLDALYQKHQKDGLMVVGVYHPKPKPKAVKDADVKKYAEGIGVHFPVAVDADWTVLRRWWLSGRERAFTSVSFLIDRTGTIRWMHRGGEFHQSDDPEHKECDAAWKDLQRVLEAVLKEPQQKRAAN